MSSNIKVYQTHALVEIKATTLKQVDPKTPKTFLLILYCWCNVFFFSYDLLYNVFADDYTLMLIIQDQTINNIII